MPGSRRTAAGPAAADEQYRQRALEQLWRLRDEELIRAGHSAPAYVAARVANELSYPQPLPPMSKYALDHEVTVMSLTARPPRASWCDPDRQIVTGRHREQLMQWLPQVVDWTTTTKQIDALDGINAHTSLTYVRELLASEGFEQVCDVYGNAGPAPAPRTLYDYHPVYDQALRDAVAEQRDPNSLHVTNRVALVLCSRTDGFLATVYATATGDAGLRVHEIAVFYNVMVLDWDLSWAGTSGNRNLAFDEHDALTMIQVGEIATMPAYQSGGSLRVGLAALRAFARPVAPWYQRPFVGFGNSGSELLGRIDEILTGLPDWVHTLLGPQLTYPSANSGARTD